VFSKAVVVVFILDFSPGHPCILPYERLRSHG
jgi:hypothetical protein